MAVMNLLMCCPTVVKDWMITAASAMPAEPELMMLTETLKIMQTNVFRKPSAMLECKLEMCSCFAVLMTLWSHDRNCLTANSPLLNRFNSALPGAHLEKRWSTCVACSGCGSAANRWAKISLKSFKRSLVPEKKEHHSSKLPLFSDQILLKPENNCNQTLASRKSTAT